MFFVLWEQRKNSVSERGIWRSEVRFLIGTKNHLSLFRAQNLPSLLFYVQATFLITLFHLFHTKQNQRCLGVASWLSQSFASCAAHGFCAYGPMNFVRNITWIEIEGNCIFETCWLRSHIKLPWNNIILLLRDIQVIWQWTRVFLRVSFKIDSGKINGSLAAFSEQGLLNAVNSLQGKYPKLI